MNIHLADSLEEFDLRYIESCNQCFSSIYSDDLNHKDFDSKKLTLSSPLLNNDDYPKFSSSTQFPIFNDTKQVQRFKKPPLKPKFKSNVFNCPSALAKNLGNPFYKPSPSFIKSRDESPTKKRKTSYGSASSFDSLLSFDAKSMINDTDNTSEKSESDKDSESEFDHDSLNSTMLQHQHELKLKHKQHPDTASQSSE